MFHSMVCAIYRVSSLYIQYHTQNTTVHPCAHAILCICKLHTTVSHTSVHPCTQLQMFSGPEFEAKLIHLYLQCSHSVMLSFVLQRVGISNHPLHLSHLVLFSHILVVFFFVLSGSYPTTTQEKTKSAL